MRSSLTGGRVSGLPLIRVIAAGLAGEKVISRRRQHLAKRAGLTARSRLEPGSGGRGRPRPSRRCDGWHGRSCRPRCHREGVGRHHVHAWHVGDADEIDVALPASQQVDRRVERPGGLRTVVPAHHVEACGGTCHRRPPVAGCVNHPNLTTASHPGHREAGGRTTNGLCGPHPTPARGQWRHDEATISPLRRNIARCRFDRGRVRRRAGRFPRSRSRYKASLLDGARRTPRQPHRPVPRQERQAISLGSRCHRRHQHHRQRSKPDSLAPLPPGKTRRRHLRPR